MNLTLKAKLCYRNKSPPGCQGWKGRVGWGTEGPGQDARAGREGLGGEGMVQASMPGLEGKG